MQSKKPVRILIVKIAAIGDVVMALPLLSAIRKKYPHVHITWLCGSQVAGLIDATRLVDRIVEVNEKQLLTGSFCAKLLHLMKAWCRLGLRRFDVILTLHRDRRYRFLSIFSLSKHRKQWGKIGQLFYPRPGCYHAEENLYLLDACFEKQAFLKKETANQQPIAVEFPVVHASLRGNLSYLTQRKPLIAIAPGGAKNVLADDFLRRWPIDSYACLIQSLIDREMSVIVTGSESDRWVYPFLPKKGFYNCISQLDLLDLVAVLENCSLLITHDSGSLHLAKLARCPTIGLFGPTDYREKTSACERIHVIRGGEGLSCCPCYNGKTYASCENNLCLSRISPDCVLQAALQIVSS